VICIGNKKKKRKMLLAFAQKIIEEEEVFSNIRYFGDDFTFD